jgi:TPR repeat protein
VETFCWLQSASNNGNKQAINFLACRYPRGQGVAKDPTKAVALFQRAADTDNGLGQGNHVHCYAHGIGVTKYFDEAMKCYRRDAVNADKGAITDIKNMDAALRLHRNRC